MFKKTIGIALAVTLAGVVAVSTARADELDKKTVLTFSQPVEIPGHVLPAGTYIFKLLNSMTDRHVVQVFNADGSKVIATILAIPDYRLTPTDKTVIKFAEVPAGSPEVIRAWFYPGNTIGQEFVYPRTRAAALAKASKSPVPAMAADVTDTDADALKTARIIAVTPEEKEIAVTAAIQTTPPASTTASVAPRKQLPKTASPLPWIVLFGLTSIAVAFSLIAFGKREYASTR
jgi:LPXTG-motif cell wall-anchored protein